MFQKLSSTQVLRRGRLTRRDLLRRSGLMALPALLTESTLAGTQSAVGSPKTSDVYESIGVRPLINCRGTFTIISGSLMLPEVRTAMEAAAQRHVHLDELMEAIGQRLAELTRAEWGMVSSGCAAGLTHATAACVAGGNPDLHIRIPNLAGFPKDEVIIPKHSRNVYDAAVRAVGVRVIEVGTTEELEAALGPRTAMIYILAGPRADAGPPAFDEVVRLAARANVPILVDAAAEVLTVPCVHLERGAALVGYSGGKCLRGPQTAGLLLGRKDLVRAAWVHSAPHHGFARSMKVGKEEAVAMLKAVEMWIRRDHAAEWKTWLSWLDHIDRRVSQVPGIRTSVKEPTELSNRTPALAIRWNRSRLGLTGAEVSKLLLAGQPRIAVPPERDRDEEETGISVVAYMMSAGDEKIVAERVHEILSQAGSRSPSPPAPPTADLTGRWDVRIQFASGTSDHTLYLKQVGNHLEGTHQGDFVARDLKGSITGNLVSLSSSYSEQHGDALNFRFSGSVSEDAMNGTLDMGEYLGARWSAKRHSYRRT
ncbi:MAG: hypothetical protein AB1898_06470 [Acidobacteriota bacterium]